VREEDLALSGLVEEGLLLGLEGADLLVGVRDLAQQLLHLVLGLGLALPVAGDLGDLLRVAGHHLALLADDAVDQLHLHLHFALLVVRLLESSSQVCQE
jgi:hypothetical protein